MLLLVIKNPNRQLSAWWTRTRSTIFCIHICFVTHFRRKGVGRGGGGERQQLEPFLDTYPWASESLSLRWVQIKYILYVPITMRSQMGEGSTNHLVRYLLGDTPCTFNAKSARNSHFIHGSRPEKLSGLMCSNNKNFERLCIKYLTRGAKGVQPCSRRSDPRTA